jgi:hypothetical protein
VGCSRPFEAGLPAQDLSASTSLAAFSSEACKKIHKS